MGKQMQCIAIKRNQLCAYCHDLGALATRPETSNDMFNHQVAGSQRIATAGFRMDSTGSSIESSKLSSHSLTLKTLVHVSMILSSWQPTSPSNEQQENVQTGEAWSRCTFELNKLTRQQIRSGLR